MTQLPTWRPLNWATPKLTPGQRDAIRRRLEAGETARDLALEYRVSVKTIHRYR